MTALRITHIGGPTALIELDGWRLLTDPTFDAPGRRYAFGWGSSSQSREEIEREFAGAPEEILRSAQWLPLGEEFPIDFRPARSTVRST